MASVLTFESSETHAEKHNNVKECTGGGTVQVESSEILVLFAEITKSYFKSYFLAHLNSSSIK